MLDLTVWDEDLGQDGLSDPGIWIWIRMNSPQSLLNMNYNITVESILSELAWLKIERKYLIPYKAVVCYTVTLYIEASPWAYETVWILLQSLPNLHTHLLMCKEW